MPQQPPPCRQRLLIQRCDLGVDLVVGLCNDLVGQGRQLSEVVREGGRSESFGRSRRQADHGQPDPLLQIAEPGERSMRLLIAEGTVELAADGREPSVLATVVLQVLGVVQYGIEKRCAFQCGDLAHHVLTRTRDRLSFEDDLLAGLCHRLNVQGSREHGHEQRNGDERQTEEHQSAQ